MKRTTLMSVVLLAVVVGLTSLSYAQEVTPLPLNVKSYGNIPYVSGGVGEGERAALQRTEKEFNVKLVFAAQAGNYLGNVDVAIFDQAGNRVLDVVSGGPWFYTLLSPGQYTVVATAGGQTKEKAIQVGPQEDLTQLNFFWDWEFQGKQF